MRYLGPRAILTAAVVALLSGCSASISALPSTSGASPGYKFTPASTPQDVLTGPVGVTFRVTTTDDSGNEVVYEVTLAEVDQNAPGGTRTQLQSTSDHLAAARFTIKGVTGQSSDDANTNAIAIDAGSHDYEAALIGTSDGGNFSDGEWTVGPGEIESGWVTFEVPPGETVAGVQWKPWSSNNSATWTVGQ
jgi:hypothetical protein